MPVVPFTAIYPDGPATAAAAGDTSGAAGGGGAPYNSSPYPELPVGAIPFDRDITITVATAAAGTLLFDPGAGRRFYLVSAFLSTDTAMRVAIIDGSDAQNQRPVDGYFAANGGATPNLVPKWYESKNTGNQLLVVTASNGNVKVRVSGFTLAN